MATKVSAEPKPTDLAPAPVEEPTVNVPSVIEELPKRKRTPVRSLEALEDVSFAKMNTLEQKKYVEHLKENLRTAEQKAEAYATNAKQSYEQASQMRNIIDRLHTESIKKNDMLRTAIRAFTTSLELIMKED